MFLGSTIKFIYLNKCLICKRLYHLYIFRDSLLTGHITPKLLLTQCPSADHVINTAWCSHNNVDTSLQAMDVFPDIGSTNAGVTGGSHVISKGYHNFLDLKTFIRKVCRLSITVCISCTLSLTFHRVTLTLSIKLSFKVLHLRNKEIM